MYESRRVVHVGTIIKRTTLWSVCHLEMKHEMEDPDPTMCHRSQMESCTAVAGVRTDGKCITFVTNGRIKYVHYFSYVLINHTAQQANTLTTTVDANKARVVD